MGGVGAYVAGEASVTMLAGYRDVDWTGLVIILDMD